MLSCLFWGGTPSTVVGAELSAYVASKIIVAQKQASSDKLSEAIKTLHTIKASKSYDKAYIAQVLGSYYWQNNQLKYAIQQVRYAVSSDQFKGKQAWSLKRMLADLLTNQRQYKEALGYYKQLTANIPPDEPADQLWLRIAQVNYLLTDWDGVLDAIGQYERFQLPDAVVPLSIKFGAQHQLERYKSAIVTVKRLLALEPNKKNWWLQLVSLELKTHDTKSALGTLALAKLNGIPLSTADFKLLAQLYGVNGMPERAARTLDALKTTARAPKDLIRSAYYWQQAKEWDKALTQWELVAQHEPQYYWNIAQIQIRQGRYHQALTSLDQIPVMHASKRHVSSETEKGKHQIAQIALAKTQVLYKLNQLEPALAHAKKADGLQPSTKAKAWIKYLTQLQQYQKKQGTG